MTFLMIEQLVAAILVVSGGIFCFFGAVGMVRLPDVYARLHSTSKAGTLGAGFLLIALAITAHDTSVWIKSIAGLFFLIMTAPIGSHLLTRAGYLSGTQFSNADAVDHLKGKFHDRRSAPAGDDLDPEAYE